MTMANVVRVVHRIMIATDGHQSDERVPLIYPFFRFIVDASNLRLSRASLDGGCTSVVKGSTARRRDQRQQLGFEVLAIVSMGFNHRENGPAGLQLMFRDL